MRSELVFAAKRSVADGYALCRLTATAARQFHRPKTRIEDTTDAVLRRIADSDPHSPVFEERATSRVENQTS
jgi:hypothetical protein